MWELSDAKQMSQMAYNVLLVDQMIARIRELERGPDAP
jgi:hypothetical protein